MRRALARAGAVVGAGVGALVLVVGGGATPAAAHAELVETEPAAGARLETAPEQVLLRYSEAVSPPDDAIEVFDSHGDQVETSSPSHPDGAAELVAVDLPELDDGAYVVTWRVASEDSHPIRGAYTFRVGDVAASDDADATAVMDQLVAAEGGDRAVGVLFGLDRFAGFVGMVLLVGGASFLVSLWPKGLVDRRARRLLAAAWVTVTVATLFGFGFQATYNEGTGLGGVIDPGPIGDVIGTRPGRVWLLRLLILAVLAVVGLVASRRLRSAGGEVDDGPSWSAVTAGRLGAQRTAIALASALGLALLATITFAGHAAAGDWVPVAVTADLVHLGAISVWLGGLTMMFAVVLRRVDAEAPVTSTVGAAGVAIDVDPSSSAGAAAAAAVDEMAAAVARFSRWALVAIVLVVASGTVQAWRQLRSFSALVDTTYGRVLIVKVVLVAVILCAAAVSREWVYRRRAWAAAQADGDGGNDQPAPAKPLSVRTLRRSVGAEVAVATLVLAVTAVLVNTVPGKDALSPTFETEQHGATLFVNLEVDPAKAGLADIRITTLTHDSQPFQPPDLRASLSLPANDVPAIPVELESSSPGVYVAEDTDIPFPGTWTLTVDVRTSEFDQETYTFQVPVK